MPSRDRQRRQPHGFWRRPLDEEDASRTRKQAVEFVIDDYLPSQETRGLAAKTYLEFAQIRKEGSNRFHGRVKRQKEQGSQSVNEEPRSHTCRTPRCTKCCGAQRARHALVMEAVSIPRRWRERGGRGRLP